jgi:hypothetical protein
VNSALFRLDFSLGHVMKIPEKEILETRNEMTVIGGEIVYVR